MALHDDDLLLVNDSQDGNEAKKIKYSTLKSNIATDVGASDLQAVTDQGNTTTNGVVINDNITLNADGSSILKGGMLIQADTAPNPQLDIRAGQNDKDGVFAFALAGDSHARIISNKDLLFHTAVTDGSSGEKVRIDYTGNVHIGGDVNTASNITLNADGTGLFTGNLRVNNESTTTAGLATKSDTNGLALMVALRHDETVTGTTTGQSIFLSPSGDKTAAVTREITFSQANISSSAVGDGFKVNGDLSGYRVTASLGAVGVSKDNTFATAFRGDIGLSDDSNSFNFYAHGRAPNFYAGDCHIGGSITRNTRQLWESLLTEEQKEELAEGTLAIPANVSTPGDGSFVRQWWYDQQSVEDQALIDSGELAYPEHLQAANFTDTFALGDNTLISLSGSNGEGKFRALDITTSTGLKFSTANNFNNYSRIYQNSSGDNDYGLQLFHYGAKNDDPTDFWRDAGVTLGGQNDGHTGRIRFYTSRDPGAEEWSYNGAWESDGSLTVGGTATGNNPTIKLSTDGTIQAANLTDGVTTKTMTEVLEGGGAKGSCIYGFVDAAGVAQGGSGYTVTKGGTGNYVITFDVKQPDANYAVVGTASDNNRYNLIWQAKTTTGFQIQIMNLANTSTVNNAFCFIVTSDELALPEVFSVPGATYEGIQGGIIFNGNTPEIQYGEGFTIVRNTKGECTITFAEEMPDANYTVVGTLNNISYGKGNFNVVNRTSTSFKVGTTNNNELSDLPFSFAVLPSDLSGDNGLTKLWGGIQQDGTALFGNAGWTSNKHKDGQYKVTFDTPIPNAFYTPLAEASDASSAINTSIVEQTPEYFIINTNGGGGGTVNRQVNFTVTYGDESVSGITYFYLDSDNNRYYLNQQFTYNGVLYPKQGVTDDLLVNTLGFTRVQVATRPSLDSQYYSVTGPNDDGSWTTAERDLAEVKVELVRNEKLNARSVLSRTDWLIIRRAENDSAIPTAVEEFRDDVRVVSNDRCVAIYAAPGISELQQLMGELDAYPAEVAGYDY